MRRREVWQLTACFLLLWDFDHQDGGSMFFRNAGELLLLDFTTSLPKKQYSSWSSLFLRFYREVECVNEAVLELLHADGRTDR
jgi:hypothetical protein